MPELAGLRAAARLALIVLAGAAVALPALAAGNPCRGVQVELTTTRQRAYAPLVAAAVENQIKPAQVDFMAILESGGWSAAYVATPIADDGVMFFQTVGGRKQFRDVWGGWAEPSERPELVAWARQLGAPDALARCFAEIVTGGD
jgi:hypothetical protein